MSNSFTQTVGGKVTVNSPFSASSDRYRFISLPNAEPNLGFPTGAVGQYVLVSEPVSATRTWTSVTNLTAVPAAVGVNTQVIFNSGGTLNGDRGFTYNYNLSTITVGRNNVNLSANSFVFGSSLTATAVNTTFVNNLSTPGRIVSDTLTTNTLYVSTGNTGIGTLTPNEKLTVVGNISATGTIYGRISAETPRAAGEDTQVQFNSAGNMGAKAEFRFNYTANGLVVGTRSQVLTSATGGGVLGGDNNAVTAIYAGVTFGQGNSATGANSFVGGGTNNVATTNNASIVGGDNNAANGVYSAVGNGRNNTTGADYTSIGGGFNNQTGDTYAFVGGGSTNNSSGLASVIGGGTNNNASGLYSGILAGNGNTVTHANSFIIGSNIVSQAPNTTFVNNLSAPGTLTSNVVSISSINVTAAKMSSTSTPTSAFLTITIGGSALAIPLFRLP